MTSESRDYIFVCTGPTCGERGGKLLLRAWKDSLVERGEWVTRRVVPVQCFGECATGPNVCVHPRGEFHAAVDAREAETVLERLVAAIDAPNPAE